MGFIPHLPSMEALLTLLDTRTAEHCYDKWRDLPWTEGWQVCMMLPSSEA